MSQEEKQKRIDEIKHELMTLGDMRPGTLSMQYHACGSPHCRCKDPENPRKHGPYHQLSFTRKGKSRTEFVREESLEHVRRQLETYARFKRLTDEWVDLSIQLAKERNAKLKGAPSRNEVP